MKYIIISYIFSCIYNIIETIRYKEEMIIAINNKPSNDKLLRIISLIILSILFCIPIYNYYITYTYIKETRNEC